MKFLLSALLLSLPLTSFASEQIIGVGMVLKQVDNKIFVESVIPGAPVAREGSIQAGDQIVAVHPFEGSEPGWVPVEQLHVDEVVQLIRGDEGHRVGLHLGRETGQFEVALTRELINVP